MRTGDKVVCVDDSPSRCKCCTGMKCPLIKWNVYVVRATGKTETGKPFVELIGIRPDHHQTVFGYDQSRFRLLAQMKSEARDAITTLDGATK